ncbi:MAG: hypothetical protein C4294_20070 [Nitrospiraceae bacterium]
MFKYSKNSVLIGTILSLAILANTVLNSFNQATAAPEEPSIQIIKDAGAWRIVVVRTQGSLSAGVTYNLQRREDITSYVEAVQMFGPKAFKGQETIPALVTFRRPLTFERFLELINTSGAKVQSYRIRTVLTDGTRGTLGGVPEPDGTIVDRGHIQRLLDMSKKRSGQVATVAGVVDAELLISRSAYERLNQNTSDVYLIDLMRAIAYQELVTAGIRNASMANVTVQGPYWFIEEFGLVGR